MIDVHIGTSQRSLRDADSLWIHDQISARRHDGVADCVQIVFDHGDLTFSLATAACRGGGGSLQRELTAPERRVWALWQRLGLHEPGAGAGAVMAFLDQLRTEL